MKNNILKKFNEKFGYEKDVRVFFSPGRVNLIGEHTDYNGGHVFPCALSFGTYGAISQRNDKIVRMYSENFEDKGIISFEIDNLKNEEEHDWANYPKGVIDVLRKHGYDAEIRYTKGPKDATRIVEELEDDVDLVISAGGDGTLNEVVTGNLRRNKKLVLANFLFDFIYFFNSSIILYVSSQLYTL